MNDSNPRNVRTIRCARVLRVREDACEVWRDERLHTARFPPHFPSPRTERVQPGHLVATAAAPDGADGAETVLWRWYDAVVLEELTDGIRVWEPAHGEVLARPRPSYVRGRVGARAYLSAGLPGAEWWAAGPAGPDPRDGPVELVELAEVGRLYTDHGLWEALG